MNIWNTIPWFFVVILVVMCAILYVRKNTNDTNNTPPEGAANQEKIDKSFKEISEKIALMNQSNKEASQRSESKLESITKVMTDKKSRGRYGEVQLETILNDAYGDQRHIVTKQHKIDGGTVDATINVDGQGLLPIDAKFSFENYMNAINAEDDMSKTHYNKLFESDTKKRVDEVRKYISVPTTTPFALMFVPSESVFAEIQSNIQLLEYASKAKVYYVSPTTLLATLAVATQIRDQNNKIKNLPLILKELETLRKHVNTYATSWEDVAKKIRQANDAADKHGRSVENISAKADKVLNSKDAQELLKDGE